MNVYDPSSIVNLAGNEYPTMYMENVAFSKIDFDGPALYEAVGEEVDIIYDQEGTSYFRDELDFIKNENSVSTVNIKTFVQENVPFPITIKEEVKADETSDTITVTEYVVGNASNEEVISFQCGYTENGVNIIDNVNYSMVQTLFTNSDNNKNIESLRPNYVFDNSSPTAITVLCAQPFPGINPSSQIPRLSRAFEFILTNFNSNPIVITFTKEPFISKTFNNLTTTINPNTSLNLKIVIVEGITQYFNYQSFTVSSVFTS